jgi:transposase
VKDGGPIQQEDKVGSTRRGLDFWMKTLPPAVVRCDGGNDFHRPDDHVPPHAAKIRVAHPLAPRVIAGAQEENDQIDASTIANRLR